MNKNNERSVKIAIVPGSFDPITYGHLDLIQRAAEQYDHVYVAVMINPDKRYMFSLEQRTQIARAAINEIPNAEVVSSEGMLWKLAKDLNACAIVKGYRNEQDLVYEEKMAEYNRRYNPYAKTVLLKSREDLQDVSSTVVRNRIQQQNDLSDLMPAKVEKVLYQILKKQK